MLKISKYNSIQNKIVKKTLTYSNWNRKLKALKYVGNSQHKRKTLIKKFFLKDEYK